MTSVPEKIQRAYGRLPSGWAIEKLKFFTDVKNSNVDKTISEDEIPVLLCNYVDVYYNDRITKEIDFMPGSATKSEIEKFQLKKGQVIITKDSEGWEDIGIPAYVSEDMPNVLCGYHLSIFTPGPNLDGEYLAWLCRSEPLNDQFKVGANGVTRYGLGQYPMKNAFITLPPMNIQKAIAKYLNDKAEKIDALICLMCGDTLGSKNLRDLMASPEDTLSGRLMEYRSALITAAVTGQIDGLQ